MGHRPRIRTWYKPRLALNIIYKMKYIIILVFLSIKSFGQYQIVDLKQFYAVQSVIFDSTYIEPIIIKDKVKRITLSIEDIKKIEIILKKQFLKKKYNSFKFHGRHYVGYLNVLGEKKAIVGIYNNKRYPKMFVDFDKEFMIGFDDFYENSYNQAILNINISLMRISK